MSKDLVMAKGCRGNNPGGFKPGPDPRRSLWKPGQSGGGSALSHRHRQEFESKFLAALVGEIPVEEVAKILADKARAGLPWAVMAIVNRLAPENLKLDVTKRDEPAVFDLTRLTDQEVDAFIDLARRAAGAPPDPAPGDPGAGEVPAQLPEQLP